MKAVRQLANCALWAIGAAAVMASGGGCATLGTGDQAAVLRAKDKVAPALVHIRPVKEVFTGGRREEVAVTGSGFIISADGYVVTNEHVAGEAEYVQCILHNREELDADVVGTDPYTDIAVLKLRGEGRNFPTAALGTSAVLEPGTTVLALGSPLGLTRSISKGIVSVTERYLPDRGPMVSPYNLWIQTDAAINPGNSGGPLVNLKGEVIGVNARGTMGADNIGFAIPIDTARSVVDALIAHGRVIRSTIGIDMQEMMRRTDDPAQAGVIVASVDPASPAEAVGIRPGDVLLAINDQPTNARFVEELPPLRNAIARLPVGEPAALTIARGGETQTIEVEPVEKTDLKGEEIEFSEWGFTGGQVTAEIARLMQLDRPRGVVVSGSQVGSVAANAGLQQGDIILTVDGIEIESLTQFRTLYRERVDSGQERVLLDVQRGAVTRYVLVKQGAQAQPAPAAPLGPEGGLDLVE